jgi:uncharacterized protein YfaS (alpha-2-macroglobulin family)
MFEGMKRQDQVEIYDRGLRVRRKWRTAGGEMVDVNGLRVGDLIRVEVELRAPDLKSYERVDNICIVDALPGGMEVENPRLATSARIGGLGDLVEAPDRVEFQDDRVLMFTWANKQTRTFCYMVRVVGTGSFEIPPIQASCMYDPAFASINGGGQIHVRR